MRTLLSVCLLALLATGCSTTGTGTSTAITPARVQAVAKLATYAAARTGATDPSKRAAYESALTGLNQLVGQECWDISTMAIIAQQNGMGFLASPEGTLALTGAQLFIDAFTTQSIDLASQPYARAVIIGSRDGLALALTGTRGIGDETYERLLAEAAATRR